MRGEPMMSSTGQKLLSDHKRLDALFERLLEDVRSGDWAVCQTTWSKFETDLLAHLEIEESLIFPSFERENPSETAALRGEHAIIRGLLADMSVRLELHAERELSVRTFVDALRAHAAREEELFYRWTKNVPSAIADALAGRLSRDARSAR